MKRCSNFYLRLSCFHWCSNSERNIQTFQLTTFTIHICCNEWIEWDKMKSISMFACTSPLDEEEKNQLVWREEVKKTVCPARVIGNAFLENLICFFFFWKFHAVLHWVQPSNHITFISSISCEIQISIHQFWISDCHPAEQLCVCDWRT